MSTLHGSPEVPFSEMFADTVATHGLQWAVEYYVRRHQMPWWEFTFWVYSTGNGKGVFLY